MGNYLKNTFTRILLFIGLHEILYSRSSYQVYKVKAKNQASFDALVSLYQESTNFDFWTEPRSIENSCDIMVPPSMKQTFLHLMRAFDIDYAVKIADVQRHTLLIFLQIILYKVMIFLRNAV